MRPCPETPNCVHTGLGHPAGTAPIHLVEDRAPEELMREVARVVAELPRTVVVSRSGDYVHAESTSRLFRFVDDLELRLTPDFELVVRSASRVGRSDLGVNGRRVESLREGLRAARLLRSGPDRTP